MKGKKYTGKASRDNAFLAEAYNNMDHQEGSVLDRFKPRTTRPIITEKGGWDPWEDPEDPALSKFRGRERNYDMDGEEKPNWWQEGQPDPDNPYVDDIEGIKRSQARGDKQSGRIEQSAPGHDSFIDSPDEMHSDDREITQQLDKHVRGLKYLRREMQANKGDASLRQNYFENLKQFVAFVKAEGLHSLPEVQAIFDEAPYGTWKDRLDDIY